MNGPPADGMKRYVDALAEKGYNIIAVHPRHSVGGSYGIYHIEVATFSELCTLGYEVYYSREPFWWQTKATEAIRTGEHMESVWSETA